MPELFLQLVATMESHASHGIRVRFISEQDAQRIPYFRSRALRGCGLYDNHILSYDTAPAPESGSPVEIAITWDADEIRLHNPFPHLEASTSVYKWPDDRDKIAELRSRTQPTSSGWEVSAY